MRTGAWSTTPILTALTPRCEIIGAIDSALETAKERSDSLVFDVFPELFVKIPGVEAQSAQELPQATMPWEEYLNRLRVICHRLESMYLQGKYVPQVFIGISNGGMVFCDLLGRNKLFWQIPKVAIWANRFDPELTFFDNPLNNAVMGGIQSHLESKERPDVLLLDDVIATGYTNKR
jgi:hypothetical protein